jgi:hypothetical protein
MWMSRQMGIFRGYVYWRGHDAGGTLPPVDVLAGLLAEDAAHARPGMAAPREGELLVHVPPQWHGDWETGHPLAPGYQYIWSAPRNRLVPIDGTACSLPYRPLELPPSATGARPRSRRQPSRRANARQE